MTEQKQKLIRLISDSLDTDITVINAQSQYKKIYVKFGLEELTLVVTSRNNENKEMFCSDISAVCDDIINVLDLSAEDLRVE